MLSYMAPLHRALLEVLFHIYDDGIVTSAQRLAIASLHGRSGLTACELEEVFQCFLSMTWGDIIDEEALTAEDWARLAMVVRELRLPMHRVPFPDLALAS